MMSDQVRCIEYRSGVSQQTSYAFPVDVLERLQILQTPNIPSQIPEDPAESGHIENYTLSSMDDNDVIQLSEEVRNSDTVFIVADPESLGIPEGLVSPYPSPYVSPVRVNDRPHSVGTGDADRKLPHIRPRSKTIGDKPYSTNRPNRKPRRGGNQSPGVFKGKRMTYAELIIEAINSTDEKRLTLRGIYEWMLGNIKEFSPGAKDGPTQNSWKNSIRHNLSLHEQFRRIPNDERGQSAYWVIDNEPTVKIQEPIQEISNNCVNRCLPVHTPVPVVGRQPIRRSCQAKQYPPNAQIHESYQTKDLDRIIENASTCFEEDYVKSKFPKLANIIYDQAEASNCSMENIQYITDDLFNPQPSPYSEVRTPVPSIRQDDNQCIFDSVFGRSESAYDSGSSHSTMFSQQMSPEADVVFTDSSTAQSPNSLYSVKRYLPEEYIQYFCEDIDADIPDVDICTSTYADNPLESR